MERDLERTVDLLTPQARGERGTAKQRATRARIQRAVRRWLKDAGTLGYGIGYRETGSRTVYEPVLRVHVAQKLPGARVGKNRIPPILTLPGVRRPIAVDVVEGSVGTFQRAMCGDGLRIANAPEGGTIACLVRRGSSPEILALTCRHVLDAPLASDVEWLEFPPKPAPPNPVIGTLADVSQILTGPGFLNRIDVALVKLNAAGVDAAIRQIGRIAGVRNTPLRVGEPVRICGFGTSRTRGDFSGLAQSEILEINSQQAFDNATHGRLGFRDLVLCKRFTEGADSGAAVVDADNKLVGVHIGASLPTASKLWSAFQPIGNVFALMNLSLVTVVPGGGPARESAAGGAVPPRPPPPVDHRPTAIDTLARTIWGEARNQIPAGREGVANVVVNRALAPPARYGGTVEKVCRRKFQFSCWLANDPNLPKLLAVTDSNAVFRDCLDLARRAVDGKLADNTRGATHYHTISIKPKWAIGHDPSGRLGDHDFYNDIP